MADENATEKRLVVAIPLTVVVIVGVLIGGGTTCSINNENARVQRVEQREQSIRAICGGEVDLKADIARALACIEMVRR